MVHWRKAFDNEVLTAGDLHGLGDVTVTIESAKGGTVKVRGGKKRMPVLKLAGFKAPFGANPTCCKVIERMHGADMDGWVGKRIALYVALVSAPDEDGKGQVMTPAIRVRPTIPTGGDTAVREHPPLTDEQAEIVRATCASIDAAGDKAAIDAAIAPHRDAIKAIGGRAIATVTQARAARLATIEAVP